LQVNLYDSPSVVEVQKQLLGEMLQWYQETSDTTDWQVKTGRGAPKMGTLGYPVNPILPKGGRAPGDKRPNFVFYFPDTIAAESCGGLCESTSNPPLLDFLYQLSTCCFTCS
jgi:hypothetical protein